tara:strand:+ start:189 stop:560 length:372 start_codon:yes stop_codon:yes gene_type:complete
MQKYPNYKINYTLDFDDEEELLINELMINDITSNAKERKKYKYSERNRVAQNKYRLKYPEKYLESQRQFYENHKNDEEWKKKFNEKNKEIQKRYRDKIKQQQIDQGVEIRKPGRPRKEKKELN